MQIIGLLSVNTIGLVLGVIGVILGSIGLMQALTSKMSK